MPTQPPMHWVQAPLSPRVKTVGRDADHSPSSTAYVMARCLGAGTTLSLTFNPFYTSGNIG